MNANECSHSLFIHHQDRNGTNKMNTIPAIPKNSEFGADCSARRKKYADAVSSDAQHKQVSYYNDPTINVSVNSDESSPWLM
jgi:hypothetical protein